jgi:para-aminobenzoate synthetase component 1
VWPLAEEISYDFDPWDACRHLSHLPHLLFLDSRLLHPRIGRYSFITADPFDWLCAYGRQIRDRAGVFSADPFSALRDKLRCWPLATLSGLPPFQGGAAGLLGYDLCHHIERLPRPRSDEFRVPDLAVGYYDWVIALDQTQKKAWIISSGYPVTDPTERRQRALFRLQSVKRLLGEDRPSETRPASPGTKIVSPQHLYPLPGFPSVYSNFEEQAYLRSARRAIEYIHAGDCFQINLSQRLLHRAPYFPLDLFGRLRERNAAPFAGYFDLGNFVIASASPELFLRVEGGQVQTRPIKGTRPRGQSPDDDTRLREELLRSAKDRAENVMIIDLLRNDLGRVCEYGSVQVTGVCNLESYPTVHHLVSEVQGRLRPGMGPVDLLRAAFPGGSVTGAPKVRAMEIIAELEPTARGPYCGSLGYLGFDGSMDTSILIRTFTVGGGWVQFPVGGGIVADSSPEAEYEETLHKAVGLLRALR